MDGRNLLAKSGAVSFHGFWFLIPSTWNLVLRPLPFLRLSGVILLARFVILDPGRERRIFIGVDPSTLHGKVNFHAGGTWVPLTEAPEYAHPGQYDAAFYYAPWLARSDPASAARQREADNLV